MKESHRDNDLKTKTKSPKQILYNSIYMKFKHRETNQSMTIKVRRVRISMLTGRGVREPSGVLETFSLDLRGDHMDLHVHMPKFVKQYP